MGWWLGRKPTSQKRKAVAVWDDWSRAAKKRGYTRLNGYLSADGKTVRMEAQIEQVKP